MAYLTKEQLQELGFMSLGREVMVSDKAAIYNPSKIVLGDFCRIDDFCVVSGNVSIGSFVHITPQCLIAGGEPGVKLEDFTTLSYGVKIFSQSDDYSGETMTNSLIPQEYKNEYFARVVVKKHSIIGTNAVIFPGVTIEEGCSVGAQSLVLKSTKPWGIYIGTPAKRLKNRSRDLLKLHEKFVRSLK